LSDPLIIQGGMGVGVSSWRLARAVARHGQLGMVSGTACAVTLARRLQDGDTGGHLRRALAALPLPGIAERVLQRYFIAGGRDPQAPYATVPKYTLRPPRWLEELTLAGNFAEVWLAKEGHSGLVGVNYLEKVQLPLLASVYGAMLAGADVVAVGAGIPREVPAVLRAFAAGREAGLRLRVIGGAARPMTFDPRDFGTAGTLATPRFLAIVASATLAVALAREPEQRPDGFVVEGPTAGGHNAPPRKKGLSNDRGEPLYGPKDVVDLAQVLGTGLPFWLAGSQATPGALRAAVAQGAAGVQVGTAFAFCRESGMDEALRRRLLGLAASARAEVRTDALASPTGFPFKVADLEGTLSDGATYRGRPRRCDLGFLAEAVQRGDGSLTYRCAAEPVEDYVAKGGDAADTRGRMCLCNGLMSTVGLGQRRPSGYLEAPVVTAGDDLANLRRLCGPGGGAYSAADVLAHLLDEPVAVQAHAARLSGDA
jgi:NAD(P)H-dependent flavin oxidoreductase YrpB (nitropropane dioxygenase family)